MRALASSKLLPPASLLVPAHTVHLQMVWPWPLEGVPDGRANWFNGPSLSLTHRGPSPPLYVFFDNESKYWRCQTTNNLCSHAAYFQVAHIYFCLLRSRSTGPNHMTKESFYSQVQVLCLVPPKLSNISTPVCVTLCMPHLGQILTEFLKSL